MNSWEEEFKEKFLPNKSYYQSKNGIVYWSELLEHIHSLLKRQRESCKMAYEKKSLEWEYTVSAIVSESILNAEPSEEKLK